jgi:hypothetical protein
MESRLHFTAPHIDYKGSRQISHQMTSIKSSNEVVVGKFDLTDDTVQSIEKRQRRPHQAFYLPYMQSPQSTRLSTAVIPFSPSIRSIHYASPPRPTERMSSRLATVCSPLRK